MLSYAFPHMHLENLIDIAYEAGEAIRKVYHTAFEVCFKEDHSPLTLADKRSHEIILSRLSELSPAYPVLSEEGKDILYDERKKWEYFWLVDPLDGTKEFVKRNGEFTVNIALIHDNEPVEGLIYVPEKRTWYFAAKGLGAYKLVGDDTPVAWHSHGDLFTKAERLRSGDSRAGDDRKISIIGSRSHPSTAFDEFIRNMEEKFADVAIRSAGSSLKFCLVAEGFSDIYPRFGPTMEWDTGAGQCIVEEAGGLVTDMCMKRLTYNKENLCNGNFIVSASMALLEACVRQGLNRETTNGKQRKYLQ